MPLNMTIPVYKCRPDVGDYQGTMHCGNMQCDTSATSLNAPGVQRATPEIAGGAGFLPLPSPTNRNITTCFAQDVGPKLCTVPVITKLKDQMSIHAKDHPVQSTCALTLLGLSEHVDKHNELIHSGVVPLLVDSLKVWRRGSPHSPLMDSPYLAIDPRAKRSPENAPFTGVLWQNGSDVEVMELAALTLVRIAATKLGRAEIRGNLSCSHA